MEKIYAKAKRDLLQKRTMTIVINQNIPFHIEIETWLKRELDTLFRDRDNIAVAHVQIYYVPENPYPDNADVTIVFTNVGLGQHGGRVCAHRAIFGGYTTTWGVPN